jgi:hypothetical protein
MTILQAPVSLLNEVLEFLASTPTPQQIINLRPSEAVQVRLSYLLDQNRNAALTPEERTELDEYLQVDHFVTLLKARARLKLKRGS